MVVEGARVGMEFRAARSSIWAGDHRRAGRGRRWPPAERAAPHGVARAAHSIGLAIGAKNLHPEKEPDGVFLELGHHGFEHVEGFRLVGHQRVLLRIAAQADAFFQVVHREQVVFPQAVDHAEHDHALVIAHGLQRAENLFLRLVLLS